MGRLPNDGRGRLGGRAKGTPNKPKEPLDEWLARIIDKNRRQLEADLDEVTPTERALILSQLVSTSRSVEVYSALVSAEMRKARQNGTLDELVKKLGLD